MIKKKKKYVRPSIIQPDFDREVHRVLNMVFKTGMTYKDISVKTGIGVQTLNNWRKAPKDGGTRYPAGWRLDAVAEACGYKKIWVSSDTQDLSKAVPFEEDEPVKIKKTRRKRKVASDKGVNVIPFKKIA